MRRYPLSALVEATGLTEAALGRAVGLSGSSLKRAREWGLIETAADRYACKTGMVPWLVWPDWLDDAGKVCPECGTTFFPKRQDTIYCGRACGNRVRQRAYYARRYGTDPEFTEKEKARRRAYYAECADYENARARRWKAENPRPPKDPEAARRYNQTYYRKNRDRILAAKRQKAS